MTLGFKLNRKVTSHMWNKLMDIHNHTKWSDGIHEAEEIIENAINQGIEIIGISDHFDTFKCHSIAAEDLGKYIKNIKKLKARYRNKIEVLTGVEICMDREWCNLDKLPYETLNRLDYVLFEYIDWFSESVTLKEIKEYASKVSCRKGLAHTDIFKLINLYGMEYVIQVLKENNLFWEINVNPGYEYFDYIIQNKAQAEVVELFNMLKKQKIEIAAGSDTHTLRFYNISRIKTANKLAAYNL